MKKIDLDYYIYGLSSFRHWEKKKEQQEAYRHNLERIMGACITIEHLVTEHIQTYMFPAESNQSEIFHNEVLHDNRMMFRAKTKLFLAILKKEPWIIGELDGDDSDLGLMDYKSVHSLLDKVVKIRNTFAHGVPKAGVEGLTIQTNKKSIEPTEDYLQSTAKTLRIAILLLTTIQTRLMAWKMTHVDNIPPLL